MFSKRLYLPLAVVLASGLIAAGCGGGDDTSSDSVATTTQPASGDTTSGGTDNGNVPNAAVQQSVDACKQSVGASPTLSASTKSDLVALCEKAASGDIEEAQQASEEVCEKIVEDTVPAGSAQDQAKSACKQVAP